MYIENISLSNFKNYAKLNLEFSAEVNCVVGENGSGKTNLLDAVHYLCLTKSAFINFDSQLILHKEPFFFIKGAFDVIGKKHTVSSSFAEGGKKSFKIDNNEYLKLSEHIGKFPVVIISPYDTELIKDGSEVRRRFFDSILGQYNIDYLKSLIKYNYYLKNRNQLLKQFSERRFIDHDLLAPFNERLIHYNRIIANFRKSLMIDLIPVFNKIYEEISDNKELVDLSYVTNIFDHDFKSRFELELEKDIFSQRTTMGIHKDDFTFSIGEYPLKKFGSQGQQKSFMVSLKLAQYFLIEKMSGTKPILLLDDIFDKLDELRIQKIINMIARKEIGQVFISDANKERMEKYFRVLKRDVKYIEVHKGIIQ